MSFSVTAADQPAPTAVVVVTDVITKLVLQTPLLRARLSTFLDIPDLAVREVTAIYAEIVDHFTTADKAALDKYLIQPFAAQKLLSIFSQAFQDIMRDGKIDLSDSIYFMQLVENLVTLFGEMGKDTNNTVTLTSNTVMYFLYFATKALLVLTLEKQDEQTALTLLDQSFQLVKLAVLPLKPIQCKWKWCC